MNYTENGQGVRKTQCAEIAWYGKCKVRKLTGEENSGCGNRVVRKTQGAEIVWHGKCGVQKLRGMENVGGVENA